MALHCYLYPTHLVLSFLLTFGTCFFYPSFIEADETIQALIAVDTHSNLKESVKKDRSNMLLLLQVLAENGAKVHTTELSGSSLTNKNISSWVKKLPKDHNQTILFYYSGHGTRTKNLRSPWPLLAFQNGRELIPTKAIQDALKKRKPRLLIILTDCCNGYYVPKSYAPMMKSIPDSSSVSQALRSLFFEAKGTVTITASKPGHNAVGFLHLGGLMTNLLISSITEPYEPSKTWKSVVKYIASNGQRFNQIPYYEIQK